MVNQLLVDLFQAYFDCRRNKRNTKQALLFELHFEENILKLSEEILSKSYEISPSSIFIVDNPVKREICAADFRDRIVHHYIVKKLEPYLEQTFIYDSYACRKWKWTLFWVKRASRFMRAVSENYFKDAYISKLDIAWFFLSIDHEILWRKVQILIETYFSEKVKEKQILLFLCNKIIFHRPQENCIIKSSKESWVWLPKNKSLFFVALWKGLPLWNLTSQVFANLYLHEFDIFVKQKAWIKYYGRFVDDFFLFSLDKEYLLSLIPKIQSFLDSKLKLKLHPKKIYFQHFSKWFLFLGTYIKPYRSYISTRTKTNFYTTLKTFSEDMTEEEITSKRQSINSYLWFLKHCDSYYLRKKILWWQKKYLADKIFLKVRESIQKF